MKTASPDRLEIVAEGSGALLGRQDPDQHRGWVRANKSRGLKDKRATVREAVQSLVHDGDLVVFGGFGHVRVPMSLVYEIVRQRKRGLAFAGKTAVHDLDILIAGGCVDQVEVAYAFGYELRGLSRCGRRAVETGRVKVVAETSNAGFQWRFLAAAMGVPFMPARILLGTDTFARSSARVVRDPWSGKPVCLLPALYPDVAMLHVQRADKYGNSQIDGIVVEDFEIARAAKRLIVTCEEIIDEEEVRAHPDRTVIPYFLVDAVCEVPYGGHPTNVPHRYFSDERHMALWLNESRTEKGTQAYLERFVFGVDTFEDYLELVGGVRRLAELEEIEQTAALREGERL